MLQKLCMLNPFKKKVENKVIIMSKYKNPNGKIIRRPRTEREKRLKKRIIIISVIMGCLVAIFTFIFSIFHIQVDVEPDTSAELQELYNQKELLELKKISYEEMKDFKYTVDIKTDHYENIYENSQVKLVESIDYNGNTISEDIYDKSKNKEIVYISHGILSVFLGLFIGGLIGILFFKRYNID